MIIYYQKAVTVKRGKRVKPVFPIEYRLLITPRFKENEKKYVTSFALRTTNEFSNFRYEIIVKPELNDRTICLNIRGLRAPQLSIPGSGPAVYKTDIPDLTGDYNLIIIKPGKEENQYGISITKEQILVNKNPKNRFVDVVTTADEW
jgi:hypothetical protein